MQAAAAVGSLMAARQQAGAYADDAQAAYEQSEDAKIEAKQQEVDRLAELRDQLSTLDSDFAGRGVAVGTSATVRNYGRQETKMAKADISSIKYMGASKQRQYRLKASKSKKLGKYAMISGVSKAASYGGDAYMGYTGGTGAG